MNLIFCPVKGLALLLRRSYSERREPQKAATRGWLLLCNWLYAKALY